MESLSGAIVERNDIRSSLAPCWVAPEYKIKYSDGLLRALRRLYVEYNDAFSALVAVNREWESDYRYVADPDRRAGTAGNCARDPRQAMSRLAPVVARRCSGA